MDKLGRGKRTSSSITLGEYQIPATSNSAERKETKWQESRQEELHLCVPGVVTHSERDPEQRFDGDYGIALYTTRRIQCFTDTERRPCPESLQPIGAAARTESAARRQRTRSGVQPAIVSVLSRRDFTQDNSKRGQRGAATAPGTRQRFPPAPNRGGGAEDTVRSVSASPSPGSRSRHGAAQRTELPGPPAARGESGGTACRAAGRRAELLARRAGTERVRRGAAAAIPTRRRLCRRPGAVRGAAEGGGAGRYLRGRAAAGRDAGPSLGARRWRAGAASS